MTAHAANGTKKHKAAGSAEPSEAPEPSVIEALTGSLTERTRENPYAMVAAALGVGYVLGGGLFTRTTARVLELGARLAMIPAVREPLLDLAEAALDGALAKTATLTKDEPPKAS